MCCRKKNKPEKLRMYIQILEARTLLPADVGGWSDPFCKVSIGNEKFKKIYKTKYIRRTLNPRWNETCIYKYNAVEDCYQSKVKFDVYDHDSMSAADLLGGCEIPLTPYSDHKWIEQWYKLRIYDKDNKPLKCRGYIRIKMQVLDRDQDAFRDFECSDQTNIHETRTDMFDKKQDLMNQISQQHEVNQSQAQIQQQMNVDYHQKVTQKAHNVNEQMAQNPGLPPTDSGNDLQAPINPQYDNVPPGWQPGMPLPPNYNNPQNVAPYPGYVPGVSYYPGQPIQIPYQGGQGQIIYQPYPGATVPYQTGDPNQGQAPPS